jgi:ribosomal protein S27AE
MTQICPLCNAGSIEDFHRDKRRAYFRCGECALVFVDPASHLSTAEEKARYGLHENDPADSAYRGFLRRLADPLTERLGEGPLKGLDFGSGPGPTLSVIMEERGYTMSIYDPFFAPDAAVLQQRYDFVTCTEVLEHFRRPAKEWRLLLSLVKPGGWLGIMTRLLEDPGAFGTWYYKEEDTHVCFFSHATFHYLAVRDGLEVEFLGKDVIILRLPQAPR